MNPAAKPAPPLRVRTALRFGTLLRVAALLAFASAAPAALTKDDCLGCHDDASLTKDVDGRSTSLHVPKDPFLASVHGSMECSDCHAGVTDYPHEPAPAAVDCSSCHGDPVTQWTESVHGVARAKGDAKSPGCIDCHGKHDILPAKDPKSRTNRFRIPELCASCHENTSMTDKHEVPKPEEIQKYFSSVHGEGALEKGLTVSAVCSDCHGGHRILPKENIDSTISHQNVPNTCAKCHQGIFDAFATSTHGRLWIRHDRRGPVCNDCHSAHGIGSTDRPSFRQGVATGCSNCHARRAPTWRDSFHGQATSLGYSAAAKCADCHTAHLNLPASDPRSSVHPSNLAATCGACHENANARFVRYQPHADTHNKEASPQVYYVYNYLMKWLLLGTFGFFGLHTLLWLQRAVVAFLRKEFPRHHASDGPHVLRFTKYHRYTHVAIVTSFLVLAATGLPLMYSHMGWGQTLARMLGGVGVTTVLHRIFAVVTFGYALAHLFFIVRGALRGERKLFLGPDSMLPAVRDLRDLLAMAKWFFYRGPWPRFDRWTYWEKFDYFAVFWGVPVIGLSGLMLWIPGIVTRVLPGWALNVAMLIHSDEALLAIGFIFTFHFFHNHLRPQIFPMDPVMFTGRIPLEAFREERPDQYARLVEEGTLDDNLVGPPSEGQILFTKVFGFISLSIGVLLIIGIYASYIRKFFGE